MKELGITKGDNQHAEKILEKHLLLMIGRIEQSYVSIDEMKQQPEWQATISAMIEYGEPLLEQRNELLEVLKQLLNQQTQTDKYEPLVKAKENAYQVIAKII